MSKPAVYYWAPSEVGGLSNGIALNQGPIAVGNNLVLVSNTPYGTFSYINMLTPNTTTSGVSTDIIRSISITSPDDNIRLAFVISGIGTPIDDTIFNPTQVVGPISEELGGLNTNTVTSQNIYTVINSITVVSADPVHDPNPPPATNVSVGYGPNGITNYYELDCNRTSIQGYSSTYSLQVIPSPTTTLGNTVYVSLNKPQSYNNYGSLDQFGMINGQKVAFIPAYNYDSSAAPAESYFNYLYTGFQLVWLNVTETGTDSLFFTIMQQGI